MSTLRNIFAATSSVVALLALPAAAHATVLNTSAIWSDSGQSYPACNFTNMASTSTTVAIKLFDYNGVLLSSSGTITVPARQTYEFAPSGDGFAWCRFVTPAAASTVRANITVFHYTGTYYESLAISEAR